MVDTGDPEWDSYSHYTSKSALGCFQFCPLQYKKKYIDKIQAAESYAIAIGKRIHAFMDTFFDEAHKINPADWDMFILPEYTPYEQRMLSWFVNFERNRLFKICDGDFELWEPVAREIKVVNQEYELRGIIDRLDCIDDKMIIVEYKTTKSIYKPSMMKEFGFYKLLLKDHPLLQGRKIDGGCVINPRVRQVEFMNTSYESTILKALNKFKEAKESGVFNPTCSGAKYPICKMCSSLAEAQLFQCPEVYVGDEPLLSEGYPYY